LIFKCKEEDLPKCSTSFVNGVKDVFSRSPHNFFYHAKIIQVKIAYIHPGFVRVLENLESPGVLLWHFPGLESPGKGLLVLESAGNLLNSSKKDEMYGR